MEGYIAESIKQFVEVIRGDWKILIIPLILATRAVFVIKSNNGRTYDKLGRYILLIFISGVWIGLNLAEINLLTGALISLVCSIPGALILLRYDLEASFFIGVMSTLLMTLSFVYGTWLKEAEGEELIYYLIGQALFFGLIFYEWRKREEEEEEERARKERYTKVLTSSYESPLILPPSVRVVKKYSEEERQKELYELIMQDIIDKKVDEETFNAIEKIKDQKLREKLLKEAYEVKVEIEKEKAYREGELEGYMDGYSDGYSSGFGSGYAAGSDT